MSTAKRVAKNTMFLYVRIAANVIISLYSTRIILSALGVSDFGIYNLVGGAIAMLNFLNSAMAEASQRFMAFAQGEGDTQKQNRIFNVSMVLHIAIAFVVVVVLELIGYFLFKGVLEIPSDRVYVAKMVYHFMVASTFFTIIKVPYDAVLNAHENMLVVAVLGVVHSIVKLGIAIYISFTVFDQLIVFGLLMAVLSIAVVIITYTYCRKKYVEVRFRFNNALDKKLMREMGSFAGWALVSQSTFIITMQGTSVVLNSFFGVVVNAAQGVTNQVSNQLKGFSSTMLTALNPVIIKQEGRNERGKMLEASMFGNKLSFIVFSFFAIPLLIEMPYVFDLWLKDVPDFAVLFCRLNLAQIMLGFLTNTFYVAIGAIGKIRKIAVWESLIFALVLPVSYLIFKLGAHPASIYGVLIVMTLGIMTVRVYFLNRLGGLSIKEFMINVIARSLGVFVVSTLIAILPLFIFESSFIRLVFVISLSSIAFGIVTFLFGFNPKERDQILGVLTNVIKKKHN